MAINSFKVKNSLNVAPQATAPSSPALGDVYVDLLGNYFRWSGVAWTSLGSAGSGGINYLINSNKAWNFDDGASTGWGVYADAAGVSPVDGTGGSPNVTFAASATAPLRGAYSGLFTKDAANRQGQGVSVDFTLDTQDVGKPFTFSFDTSASANFTGLSGTESMRVYCYDVTNAALLPGYVDVAPGSSTTKGFFLATSSTSYRFILHVSGTGTSAWTVKVDNVTVGQQPMSLASTNTDWQQYTPTTSGFGTISNTSIWYQRRGNSLIVAGRFTFGTPAGTTAQFGLPSGLTIANFNLGAHVGRWYVSEGTSNTRKAGPVYGDTSTSTYVTFQSDDYTLAVSPFAAGLAGNAVSGTVGVVASIFFEVPISQWSSNIVSGDRAVEEYAFNSSTSDANDTTSFGNGAGGAQFVNVTAARSKRVRFQTPAQPTDKIVFEFLQNGTWKILADAEALMNPYTRQGTATFGVGFEKVSGNLTDYDVIFSAKRLSDNTTYGNDSTATNWSGIAASASFAWRLTKISGGALVGYPVGARNVIGDTTGTNTPSGYIGEANAAGSTTNSTTAHNTYIDFSNTMSLTAGNWLIVADGSGYLNLPNSGISSAQIEIFNSTDSSVVRIQSNLGALAASPTGSNNDEFGYCMVAVLNLTASKTFKVRGKSITESGTPATAGIGSRANGQLLAVRIS